MASILLKEVPVSLHERLKEEAAAHRRSMNQHALVLLEQALGGAPRPIKLPPPIKTGRKWSAKEIRDAVRAGRA